MRLDLPVPGELRTNGTNWAYRQSIIWLRICRGEDRYILLEVMEVTAFMKNVSPWFG
jgi:hypothetical protein